MSNIQKRKSSCHCINLRRAANVVSQLYDHFLEPVGLSVNQFSLLRNIGRLQPCSVSDLANVVGLERTTLVRTLKPLMDRGLIADRAAAGQRNRALVLTTQGEQVVGEGGGLWEQAQTRIEEKIGAEGIEELERLLALLSE